MQIHEIHARIMTMIFQDYWWLGLPSPFGGRNYNLEEVCKMFDRFSVVNVVFQILTNVEMTESYYIHFIASLQTLHKN